MPLASGSDKKTIEANIKELIQAGHDPDQAAAIAYKKARGDGLTGEDYALALRALGSA